MLRELLVAATTAAAIWGTAIGAAPAAVGEPLGNCIAGKMNADGSCFYQNCTEAKANGECDISASNPHYCAKQDRDGDGLACEC